MGVGTIWYIVAVIAGVVGTVFGLIPVHIAELDGSSVDCGSAWMTRDAALTALGEDECEDKRTPNRLVSIGAWAFAVVCIAVGALSTVWRYRRKDRSSDQVPLNPCPHRVTAANAVGSRMVRNKSADLAVRLYELRTSAAIRAPAACERFAPPPFELVERGCDVPLPLRVGQPHPQR
jgi:hypothetical protein